MLLFNDDLEVISPDWLTAMLEYSQEPDIGAVGAKLLYPDGRLQHIGMVLGVAGLAAHAFHQHPGVSAGYAGSAIIARNYSAVTGACLMTRRRVFDEVGGFDERFPIDFNDVDYCLRLRRAGYRVVFTPWAQLYHHESASFGVRRQDLAGLAEMRRRWADVDRPRSVLQSEPDSGLPGLPHRCVIPRPIFHANRAAWTRRLGIVMFVGLIVVAAGRPWRWPAPGCSSLADACSKSSSKPRAGAGRRSSGARTSR